MILLLARSGNCWFQWLHYKEEPERQRNRLMGEVYTLHIGIPSHCTVFCLLDFIDLLLQTIHSISILFATL